MRKLFVVPSPESRRIRNFSTGVVLSTDHRVAIEKLKLKRMQQGKKKPAMKDILIEGLELLLRKEKIKL